MIVTEGTSDTQARHEVPVLASLGLRAAADPAGCVTQSASRGEAAKATAEDNHVIATPLREMFRAQANVRV